MTMAHRATTLSQPLVCRKVHNQTSHKAPSRDIDHPDDLNVTLAYDAVWFWLRGEWQRVPSQQWAWEHRTIVDASRSVRRPLWVPRLLPSQSLGYKSGTTQSSLTRLPSSYAQEMSSGRDIAATWFLQVVCSMADPPLSKSWQFKTQPDYICRQLARKCRLVCRDWARRFSLGDPRLTVADGVVWYCAEDEWQVLPKTSWAWLFQEIVWWVEPRQQDYGYPSQLGHYHKAWYPKLIQPMDESVRSKGKARSMMSSLPVTSEQYHTRLEPSIGLRFLENVRDIDDRGLYRTCRLVCRDWARQYPFGDLEQETLRVTDQIAQYGTGGWHLLPNTYWAWSFQAMVWWAEKSCQNSSCHARWGCKGKGWYPKLLQPIDDTIRQCSDRSLASRQIPTCEQPDRAVASTLPPELFEYICRAADSESWSFRLVCRYWNEQCTPHIFKQINIKGRPERIRALWKVRAYPTFRSHVKIVRLAAIYEEHPEFPWIHLLTQSCASMHSVWQGGADQEGKFALRSLEIVWEKIRSIHYGLPRSVPRSFSHGIRRLNLNELKFRRFDELTHMACELPDLEKLRCICPTFDSSLPTELPRRRPRKSRNKLKVVELLDSKVSRGAEFTPPSMPVLSLFLSAYNAASFLSDDEIAIVLAFLALVKPHACVRGSYQPKEHTRDFYITLGCDLHAFFRFDISSADNGRNSNKIKVGIAITDIKAYDEDYISHWKNLDSTFGRLRSDPLGLCTQVVFGFYHREDMICFAENVLGALPSISGHFTVQYSIELTWWENEVLRSGWYQASLDSEELRGEPKDFECLLDVYP